MADLDMTLNSLLYLAQLALAIIAIDAVLATYLDFSFLTGIIRDITYLGGAVGVLDQLYWLFTQRLPELLDM